MVTVPKISAVIITRNEERNISYCLDTLKWCDEIIVVDMESEDATVEIAKKYTDKIFNHERVVAFDRAKKFAVKQAAGLWILLLDADEMVQKSLAMTLKEISSRRDVDIVEIPFKHYIMGEWIRHSGWGYTPLPRFFRQDKIIFTDTIHDYMHKAEGAGTMRLDSTDENCIMHFNYIDSVHFVEKLNRYTSIEAFHLFNKQIKFTYCQLLKATLREFYLRFLIGKGYKDGVRGFSLSLMMAFYRALTYIKLWEQDEYKSEPVPARYERIKQELLKTWNDSK